jgi:asparagine synthase (glutamine-hydrolysing)
MCGIAGIVSPNASMVQQQRLQCMANAMQHRGPQGEGFWIDPKQRIGFAHRRLCIIDLSERAAQPLHYLHYTIIFNGEIYNYIELKEELQKKGYNFFTRSDTEVIPAAYDYWGIDCLNKFDGMFAFALWDEKTDQLFIARDRFGEKPLFYYADYLQRGKFERFVFASEMKALWAIGIDRSMNGTMMLNYLTLGYVHNPIKKTETFYSNILSLPQGHYLVVTPIEGRVQMHKWYQPPIAAMVSDSFKVSDTPIEKFKELFFTSVQRRLRSDVSIGTSLSGGIDSSSVVAAIHELKNNSKQWKNIGFTAAFPGFEKDELEYSNKIAAHFNIKQYTITPTADDWIKYFQRLMYYQEEPLQSSSVLTQFLVYRLSKENNITVLLDGQGADEIMGGYKKYTHWYLQQLFKSNTSQYLRERKLLKKNDFMEEWSWRNYAAAFFPDKAAHALQQKAITQQNHHSFINQDFLQNYQNADTLKKPVVKQLEDILYYNTFNIGLPELLRYADRNSMAHSGEVRLPFLFHELVEFIFLLPASYKIKDGFTKWILRKSMEENLPGEIAWRSGKIGFEPPQKEWMQNRQVQEMIMASRKKLAGKKVLKPGILNEPIKPAAAHEAKNYDWRHLCAAEMF